MTPPPSETCEVCGRPSPLAYLCPADTRRLRSWFRDLTGHASDLSLVVSKQTSPGGERVKVRGKGESPMVWDEDAADVRWALHNTLSSIVRDLCESRGVTYPHVDTSQAMAAWLGRNTEAIALSPGAGTTYDEVKYLAAHGTSEPDQKPTGIVVRCVDIRVTPTLVGPCDVVLDTGLECGGDVRVYPGETTAVCKDCEYEHNMLALQVRTLSRLRAETMTARQIGAVLNGVVKPDTITKWKRRSTRLSGGGVFSPAGITKEGADLFRVGDVIDILEQARTRLAA